MSKLEQLVGKRRIMQKEELIPVQQVLDDMYADKGPISWAARDYYYQNYATPEEQKRMNREDKIKLGFSVGFVATWFVVIIGLVIYAIV